MSPAEDATVAVVGLGYVGLPLALLVKKRGYDVVGIDINGERVARINKQENNFKDDAVSALLKKYPITATTSFEVVSRSNIVIICVPTPANRDHMPNLEYLKSACRSIAARLKGRTLVVVESTVNPPATREVVAPLLETGSGLRAGHDFYLSHCPERINPGDQKWTVENIPRVVGSFEKVGLAKTVLLYRSLIDAKVVPMNSLEEAEAVKMLENCFRDVNIALINEFAQSFAHLGVDVDRVIQGASTKPFGFLPHRPGCGVGGQCIPVNPYYMIDWARRNGFDHRLLMLAREINESMPNYTARLLFDALIDKHKPIEKATVTLLGLAYKPESDNIDEAPSFDIIQILKEKGMRVKIYDPHVPKHSTASSLSEALDGADAALVVTAHKEFVGLTPQILTEKGVNIVIDGRNCLDKEAFLASGIDYRGIGR